MYPLLTAFLKNACQVRTEGQHREERWLFKLYQLRADTVWAGTWQSVCVCVRDCVSQRSKQLQHCFLCPFPFGGSFSRLFWGFLCLWLKHSISVPGQEKLESMFCQSGHLHPCATLTSWLLFGAFLPIQPTHTRLDIMHGNIHWYPWPIFFPIKLMCTLTHSSQRFLPPLFCDYTERPGSRRQRWDTRRCAVSEEKLRELWQPPCNPGEKFSEMCHTAFPVCHEYRPCVLLRETATVATQICTHLCISANISHSLAAPLTTIQLDFLP